MKKYLILILVLTISSLSQAQKIKKNEVDKFTKSEIIETSIESLYSVNLMGTGWCNKFEFSLRRVNGNYSMPASILMNDIVKYTEEDGVTFLLENEETVTLKTNFTGVGSESFGKGYWFRTSFNLSPENIEKLKNNKITAIRINYLGGKYDRDIKGNKQSLIINSFKLFDSL